MKLEKLTIRNFMSIREAVVELSDQGLVLVQGRNQDDSAFESNGAGKSTIFEALSWNLFDKTIRGIPSKEIVNRDVGRNTSVHLDYKDDQDIPTRISRYRNHKEHKNAVYVFKGDKNITSKSAKDTNLMIEEMTQMDFLTFSNSILFGQGLIKTFTTATDKEKKEILEKMLQMNEIKKSLDIAKTKLSDEENALVKLENENLRTTDAIQDIKDTIDQLQTAEEEQTRKAKEELAELEAELKQAQKTLQDHNKNSEDYSQTLETFNELRDKVDEQLDKFKEVSDEHDDVKSDIRMVNREITSLERQISNLENEMSEIAEGRGSSCPACGQEITEETVEDSLRHVAEKMVSVRKDLRAEKKRRTKLKKDLKALETTLEKATSFEDRRNDLTESISDINASIRSDENLRKSYESQITNLQASIDRIKDGMGKTYKDLIKQKQADLKKLTGTLKGFDKRKDKLKEKIENLEFWVEAFGNTGIKSYLLDSVTPFLNERANRYLNKLAGNTTTIEFSTQTRLASGELRDKFEVRIMNAYGGDSYESNSTGERRRIDLAISLALQDLVMSRSNARFNIMLYDEVFDGLDAVGCENVISLLQEMQSEVGSIFVITHNDNLKTYFDKYLVATKDNGETRVHKE